MRLELICKVQRAIVVWEETCLNMCCIRDIYSPISIALTVYHVLSLSWSKELTSVQIRAKRDNHLARIAEVGGIAAFTVGSMFFLAWWLGRCVEVPSWKIKNYGYSFHCNNGNIPLADPTRLLPPLG